jgi:hypothetical protein
MRNGSRRDWVWRNELAARGKFGFKARIKARSMMENEAEIEDLRERDRRVYGHPDGPTFDELVAENRRSGLQGDDVYERIIKGAFTTNRSIDSLFRGKGPDT